MREERNDNICPKCRFPKRISGHVFIKNTQPNKYIELEKLRCPLCRHLPDYKILSIDPKKAEIIYRNFDNSVKYFEDVKKWLEDNGFEVVKPTTQNTGSRKVKK